MKAALILATLLIAVFAILMADANHSRIDRQTTRITELEIRVDQLQYPRETPK